MNTPAFEPARIECVRGIPVILIAGRLDTTSAPLFDAQAAALLDQGAVIDARDEAGRTPLLLAVTQGRVEIVRLLLARGADPNAVDNTGHTPLQLAKMRNLQDVAALLQEAGAH